MPSDAKAKRAAQKKARMLNKAKNADSPAGSNTGSGPSSLNGDSAPSTPMMSANNSTSESQRTCHSHMVIGLLDCVACQRQCLNHQALRVNRRRPRWLSDPGDGPHP